MLRPQRRMKLTNSMQTLFGFDNLPNITHAVATVGSYDGVHSGHKVLIEQVISRAKIRGGESVVITFEPHPRITLGQDEGLKLLSIAEEKAILLEQLGVDYMLIIPFDIEFSRLSPEQFVADYLIAKVGVEEIVIGYNHHFGYNKSGDYDFLATHNIDVTRIDKQLVENSKVSSTIIRATIESGDMARAAQLLGHTYIIIGDSDANGFVATSKYKLLPPPAEYDALVNGGEQRVTIAQNGVYCNVAEQKIVISL